MSDECPLFPTTVGRDAHSERLWATWRHVTFRATVASVVRVMASRGYRWLWTLLAAMGTGIVILNGVGQGRLTGEWLMVVLFGASAALSTFAAVMAWTTPVVVFSGQGIKLPARALVPWSDVVSVNLGRPIPWPSTPEVVLQRGKRFTFPTADRTQLANAEALIPDVVRSPPSQAS